MSGPLRVGMVGTSWFAETLHLGCLESHPKAVLAAVCGRDRSRTEALAARHGDPAVFTDDAEMMSSGLLDAVVIVTPDDLHREMTLRALDNGLHVLCEKPLARTAADARELWRAAEAAGKVHMTMFTWRWFGVPSYARRLIAEGYLGRWRHAQLSMQADYGESADFGWRIDPDHGSGILGDLGSHLIDLARCYVGEISTVSAKLTTAVTRYGPDGGPIDALNDSAMLLLEFANGASGTLEVSAHRLVGEAGPAIEIRLYGDDGSLRLDFDLAGGRIRGRRRGDEDWSELAVPEDLSGIGGGNPSILDLAMLAPFTNLPVADRLFVDAVLDGCPAEATFEDGWRAQQVVDAAVASQRQRGWVSISSG
ncbi:MAG TPA: Gfo/Idh/MocA family oxidoreductase [Microlunatus sp.]